MNRAWKMVPNRTAETISIVSGTEEIATLRGDNQMTNAALIVEARELLYAFERAIDVLEGQECELIDLDEARALIASAKGEPDCD